MTWMIYGANGYTGELVAREAVRCGERPILAARSPAVGRLAAELKLPKRVFSLDQIDLTGVDLVIHCAGPFSRTSAPMVDACLRQGVHYLDLSGEIDVLEAVYARHDEATAGRVALIPAIGFDVVPTDHLVTTLFQRLPTATRAEIALISRGGFSRGTLRTVAEGARMGGRVRVGGELAKVPTAHRIRRISHDGQVTRVTSVPLGDVSSCFHATGITDIINYTMLPSPSALRLLAPLARRVLDVEVARAATDLALSRLPAGPGSRRRANTRSDLWAELSDPSGRTVRAGLRVPNTYTFTAKAAVHAARTALTSGVSPGAWTPSQAFGSDFVTTIPSVDIETIDV